MKIASLCVLCVNSRAFWIIEQHNGVNEVASHIFSSGQDILKVLRLES